MIEEAFAKLAGSMLGGGGGVPMSGAATASLDASGWTVNMGGKAAAWVPVVIAGACVLAVIVWAAKKR